MGIDDTLRKAQDIKHRTEFAIASPLNCGVFLRDTARPGRTTPVSTDVITLTLTQSMHASRQGPEMFSFGE